MGEPGVHHQGCGASQLLSDVLHPLIILPSYMGVSKNMGFPPKCMMKIMENPMNKWMIWWYHYFWKHPYRGYFINREIRIPFLTNQYFMESRGPRVF